MSKIIVRRQEYANNGTHANEIEAVVKENLIANTLSSATDIAPSVGLLKSVNDILMRFFPQNWSNGINMNNLNTTGAFWLSHSLTNNPENISWFLCLVFATENKDTIRQICFPNNQLNVYVRIYQSGSWSGWSKHVGIAV